MADGVLLTRETAIKVQQLLQPGANLDASGNGNALGNQMYDVHCGDLADEDNGIYAGKVCQVQANSLTITDFVGDIYLWDQNGNALVPDDYYICLRNGNYTYDDDTRPLFTVAGSVGNGKLRGTLSSDLEFEGTATMTIADSEDAITVSDWLLSDGQSIDSGTKITVFLDGGTWYVDGAQCS